MKPVIPIAVGEAARRFTGALPAPLLGPEPFTAGMLFRGVIPLCRDDERPAVPELIFDNG